MESDGPIRLIGRWSELDDASRERLVDRNVTRLIGSSLRNEIAALIEDVRARGDAAVVDATARFDGVRLDPVQLKVGESEFWQAEGEMPEELSKAIDDAIDHSRRFNERLAERGDWEFEIEPGLIVGQKVTAIESSGLFVPSGKGSFPSVLIQIGTPAVVAGVKKLVVLVPPVPGGDGRVDPAVLVVARRLGISEVYRANGPAGIAALAFGTSTFPKVWKVVGPGSPPVVCAQMLLAGYGMSTMLVMGPSESLVVADDSADPELLAADLLNEAEHGPDSTSLLVTPSLGLMAEVQKAVTSQLALLPEPRRSYAEAAIGVNGGVVLVADLNEAAIVANSIAPEHMQIAVREPEALLPLLCNAGEILVGQATSFSAANFVIGCPAALPTNGYAKVAGGGTVDTFRKQAGVAKGDWASARRMASSIRALAAHEGFPAHEAAARLRERPCSEGQVP